MDNDKAIRFFGIFVAIAIFLFLIPWITMWVKKSRERKTYSIVIYDVNGQIIYLDYLRVNFRTIDVAWSFMKEYKKMYPFYDFGLVSFEEYSESPTMIKYL
ncbi:MAG: hypothetical protein GWN01_09755 [Nitrosopumilaceae archaeon]|nr:hypothetical protein [Nitrosopumilaceae archaeon]NIU01189.1 hypothetical protein [Nitrosopumilaceae archaeon]NIU87559.1 hypothetical protein [Nitrosopumilaceae archaeon]NIV66850.1 hypothetical protein [Nitrosopumilaceae archaeon]NIX61791.1 hypothetical protein [Nitrosopumilaceae archaeon]